MATLRFGVWEGAVMRHRIVHRAVATCVVAQASFFAPNQSIDPLGPGDTMAEPRRGLLFGGKKN